MSSFCASDNSELKLGESLEQEPKTVKLQEEIRKYIKLLPEIPEPNVTRVQEIKEQIQRGTYAVTPEMVGETASRLALRFLRKE